MASHFSCIGLTFETATQFEDFLDRIYNDAHTVPLTSPDQRYRVWSPGAGVQLWLQEDRECGIVGADPHYEGRGRVLARVTALRQSESHPFDGSFYAWSIPDNETASDEGNYPFLVDIPDFQRAKEIVQTGQAFTLQIAAFPHELTVYGSEAEYDAAQEKEPRFAVRSFIPSGLFVEEGSEQEARAHAVFTGIVQEAEARTNPATDAPFTAALVDTYGGTYDVVIPPEFGTIGKGNVIQGQFWLSGRVVA